MPPPPRPGFLCYPSGIEALPVELLSRIFALGAGFSYLYEDSPFLLKPNQDHYPPLSSFPLLVSHVCQRWRQIAVRTPSLWTTIHFREVVHLARARAYLDRCTASPTYPYLLDILVDTVAPDEHVKGVTLCRKELEEVFSIIIPHVGHWRSFHLKIRDNVCKTTARRYLSTCGPAPSLETLQLYHFENYVTVDNLYEATHRPPVIVFENAVPKLRNVSLIGVNLPWLKSPYLMNLQKLELALHPDNIRPPYDSWDRMLRLSPQLQSLTLHYSGPRLEGGEPSSAWGLSKEKIALDMLSDLKFTDLDPEYLCSVVDRLYVPNARRMAWHLPEQDFTVFIELLAKKFEKLTTSPDNPGSTSTGPGTSGGGAPAQALAPPPPKRRSKISISSLLSSDSEPEASDADGGGDDVDAAVMRADGPASILFAGPLPHLGRLESLTITALECSLSSWEELLRCMEGLKQLEVDFRRVPKDFWRVLAGSVTTIDVGIGAPRSTMRVGGASPRGRMLLPHLEVFKAAGIPGEELQKEMIRRAKKTPCGGGGLRLWVVRWSPALKGEDAVLDEMVEIGHPKDGPSHGQSSPRRNIKVEAYCEEEEEELEEEEMEPEFSQDEDSPASP